MARILIDESPVMQFCNLSFPCFFKRANSDGEPTGDLLYVPAHKGDGKFPPVYVVKTGCLDIQLRYNARVIPIDVYISTE